ncbi:hypothetical protein [Piscinibacter gummiphilus]|uniref:Uncharacterized protein n=1 Tax=Piscinibacter gummiphilus TaxID=946333 RepID=A0ABZ0CLN8_9BURK|nr:hypothetical protein [Piscinibacter gummiphilus]WOB05887.1 hypothetical protein RXV79_13240 [Piscinibacter gummiphilus]
MDLNVTLALAGLLSPNKLNLSQQEEYLDQVEARLLLPSPLEEAFFAERRRRGVGVGMDDDGRIVFQHA